MTTRRRIAAHVYEVLPYRHTAAGRECLVHQDGSVIRGRYAGGNLAEEASWALAEASGYVVWFRRWLPYFLGVRDMNAEPRLYQFAPDLTGLQPGEIDGPAMVWAGHDAMIAIGDARTGALYDQVIAHLQKPCVEVAPAAPRDQLSTPAQRH